MIAPTPAHRLLDARGRPYFLWDCDVTDEQLRAWLRDPDPVLRSVALGTLMRQAKPDDVFQYVGEAAIRRDWVRLQPLLGRTREFWTWLLATWDRLDAR